MMPLPIILVLAALGDIDSSAAAQPRIDPRPIHINAEYSPRQGFPGPVVTKDG
jgi:hypothetical protein